MRPEPRPGRPDLAATPEAELVEAARARDEAAIRELIRRLNPRLYRVARGVLGSDAEAEEVVQEAYLAAFTRLDEFRGAARFSTWITRIALNAALMRRRASRDTEEYDTVAEPPNILPFPAQGAETGETSAGRGEVRRLLEAAVAELPQDLRLVFLLSEAEGMGVRAIAGDLALNPVTVRTRLFRARRRLRATLERRLTGGFDSVFPFGGARCARMADRVVELLEGDGKA